ncbi:MAG TPA: beta-eliminating lyase-related protein, partial [Thermoanaerobaculia bacterium]
RASSYGFDPVTERLRRKVRELFECDLEIFPLATGTAANSLAIAVMTPPWGGVFCHEDAHIQRDELGAPEFFSAGAKLIPLPGAMGRLDRGLLAASIDEIDASRRTAIPASISLTQATEAGTLYRLDEMQAIGELARRHSLGVHVDGARFANAVAALSVSPAELTWKAGVDVLGFGATKNGALAAELLVVFRKELAQELTLRIHRSGHRFSKMRFLSAQFEAYLEGDLWLRNARHANAMAKKLGGELQAAGVELLRPVEANVVFARFTPAQNERLNAAGFLYHEWPIFGPGAVRLVTGFSTQVEDVDTFCRTSEATCAG